MKSMFSFVEKLDGFHDKNYAVAGAISDKWWDGKRIHVLGTITFSGSYPTGGELLNMVTSLSNSIQGGGSGVWTVKQPNWVSITGKGGFEYMYDYSNQKVMVYTNTAGGANGNLGEHTAAAYAAGVTADIVKFYAIFPR